MTEYTVEFNGVDFSDIVELGSYHTERIPVTRSITNLAGVKRLVELRERGYLSFATNPMTQEKYISLCQQMLHGSVSVRYTCMQTGEVITETMEYEGKAADFLEKCKYLQKHWVTTPPIALTQL